MDQKNRANTNTTVVSGRLSGSSSDNSKRHSSSWRESEFSSDILRSSSGNYESSTENDVVESKNCTAEKKAVKKLIGVTVGEECMEGETSGNTTTMVIKYIFSLNYKFSEINSKHAKLRIE